MDIKSTSYTNKDFRQVFSELLELVPELTDKWNPNSSNEADPGVVLLKLKAFIADKLNYNIDKNILETFPSTVTQRGNAQELYDLLGYTMRYYTSATVPVMLAYSRGTNSNGINGSFVIPKYTELRDDTGTIVYTMLESATIYGEDKDDVENPKVKAIEGTIHDLTVNGSTVITINNLDSDNRIYFKETMIPTNGIFVFNVNRPEALWEQVDSIHTTVDNKYIYKFGIDPHTNTCYLQFSDEAPSLFEGGICVKYVTTQGSNGSISAFTLTSLNNEVLVPSSTLDLVDAEGKAVSQENVTDVNLSLYTMVTNIEASTQGTDPEELKEAYDNYKKSIGTFDTLVSLRDYNGSVKNYGQMSNGIVADRTSDINHSYIVKSDIEEGSTDLVFAYDYNTSLELSMDAFDLNIYALKYVDTVENYTNYKDTFKPSMVAEASYKNAVSKVKSIQHNWVEKKKDEIAYIKNVYTLTATVLTFERVSKKEAEEIKKAIQTTLYKKYNSTQLTFGQDIDYSELLQTLVSADVRIKDIILNLPTLKTYAVVYDSKQDGSTPAEGQFTEIELPKDGQAYAALTDDDTLAKKIAIDIVARSVLAGKTPLFIEDVTTPVTYGMKPTRPAVWSTGSSGTAKTFSISTTGEPVGVIGPVVSMTAVSQVVGQIKEGATTYTVPKNTTVHLFASNYITTATISGYLYVGFKLKNTAPTTPTGSEIVITGEGLTAATKVITANSIYKIKENEVLYITENASDMQKLLKGESTSSLTKKYYIYEQGTIIKPNYNIEEVTYDSTTSSYTGIVNLETTRSIDIVKRNEVAINTDNKVINAVWQTSKQNNQLFDETCVKRIDANKWQLQTILSGNDMFIYTDNKMSGLVILYSGTRLKMGEYNTPRAAIDAAEALTCNAENIQEVASKGITSSIEWVKLPQDSFITEEMQILSLGEGAELINGVISDGTVIDGVIIDKGVIHNTPQKLLKGVNTIQYKVEGNAVDLPLINVEDMEEGDTGWEVYSTLAVVCTPEKPFELDSNQYLELEIYTVDYTGREYIYTVSDGVVTVYDKEDTVSNSIQIVKPEDKDYYTIMLEGDLPEPQPLSSNDSCKVYHGIYTITFDPPLNGESEAGKLTIQKHNYVATAGSCKQSILPSSVIALTSSEKQDMLVTQSDGSSAHSLYLSVFEQVTADSNVWVENNMSGKVQIIRTPSDNYVSTQFIFDYSSATNYEIKLPLTPAFQGYYIPFKIESDSPVYINFGHGTEGINLVPTFTYNSTKYTMVDGVYKEIIYVTVSSISSVGSLKISVASSKLFSFDEGNTPTGFKDTVEGKVTVKIHLLPPKKMSTTTLSDFIKSFGDATGSTEFTQWDHSIIVKRMHQLATIGGYDKFNYSYQVPEEELVENPLDPEMFFDENHIWNGYVLPFIDTRENSQDIKLANQSLR